MALKSFYSLTPAEIRALEGKTVCVQEKVAMPHIWIRLDENGVTFLRDRKPVTEIDLMLDDTYGRIKEDFFDTMLDDETIGRILNLCGPCELKMFYLFDAKPFYMEYNFLYKAAKRYFISDIWLLSPDADKSRKFEYIDKIVDIVDWTSLASMNMLTFTWTTDDSELREKRQSGYDMIFEVLRSHAGERVGTISHKGYNSVLGFVVKSGNNAWQITNMEYLGDPYDESHAEIRKAVLSDFIEKVLSDKDFLNSLPLFIDGRKERKYTADRIYLDVMQKAFLHYIGSTDLINEKQYKPEDLRPQIPQTFGYISSIDMSMITNDSVRVVCQYNKVMQELLRLLIHTFYRINSYTFYSFNEFETKKISDFILLFS